MQCVDHNSLRQEHQAAVQNFRASIRDLVALVDHSAADSDFNLAHRRIRVARRACEADGTPGNITKENMGAEIQSSPLSPNQPTLSIQLKGLYRYHQLTLAWS